MKINNPYKQIHRNLHQLVQEIKGWNMRDERHIYLGPIRDTEAIRLGCRFRAILSEWDMGGWKGEDLEEFKSSVYNGLIEDFGRSYAKKLIQEVIYITY